jgi:tetratricopeptide (TPR) repeat protein
MRSYSDSYLRLMRVWSRDQPATTLVRARAFLRRFPQSANVWSHLGPLLTSMARYAEARSALATSIRLDVERGKAPTAWTYVMMGDSFEQAGDFPTALAWYRRALELGADDADIHFALGYLLHRWGRLDEAEELLRKPRQCTTGDRDEPWYMLGLVQRSRERFAEAERCFRKALKIDARNFRAKRALADTRTVLSRQRRQLVDRGNAVSSATAYEQMDQAWHDDKPSHNVLLARAYLAQCPWSFSVWLELGIELSALSRYDEARAALRTSIRLREEMGESPFRGSFIEMGQSYRRAGDYESARTWLAKAVEAAPEDAGVHIFLGALLAKWGRFEEAKAMHRRGTACEEGLPDEAWHNVGLILRAQDRLAESGECFERALAIDCNYTAAQDALADVTLAMRLTRRRHAARPGRADLAAIG